MELKKTEWTIRVFSGQLLYLLIFLAIFLPCSCAGQIDKQSKKYSEEAVQKLKSNCDYVHIDDREYRIISPEDVATKRTEQV